MTDSFINPATAKQIACAVEEIDVHICASTPMGSVYQTDRVVRNCPIMIQNRVLFVDLIVWDI